MSTRGNSMVSSDDGSLASADSSPIANKSSSIEEVQEAWKGIVGHWEPPQIRSLLPDSFHTRPKSDELEDLPSWEPLLSEPLLEPLAYWNKELAEKELADFTQNIDTPLPLPPVPSFAPADIFDREFVPSHTWEEVDPHPRYHIALSLLGRGDGLRILHALEKTSVYKNDCRIEIEREEHKMKNSIVRIAQNIEMWKKYKDLYDRMLQSRRDEFPNDEDAAEMTPLHPRSNGKTEEEYLADKMKRYEKLFRYIEHGYDIFFQ